MAAATAATLMHLASLTVAVALVVYAAYFPLCACDELGASLTPCMKASYRVVLIAAGCAAVACWGSMVSVRVGMPRPALKA